MQAFIGSRKYGLLAVVAAIACFVVSMRPHFSSWSRAEFTGGLIFMTEAVDLYQKNGTTYAKLEQADCPTEQNALACFVVPSNVTGETTLFKAPPGTTNYAEIKLDILPKGFALWAALGALLLFGALPFAIYGDKGGGWGKLLAESGGGLSLSRTQLFLWVGTAFVAYMAMSIPRGGFLSYVPQQILVLLGLAGATSGFSLAGNPNRKQQFELHMKATWDEARSLLPDLVACADSAPQLPQPAQGAKEEVAEAAQAVRDKKKTFAQFLADVNRLYVEITDALGGRLSPAVKAAAALVQSDVQQGMGDVAPAADEETRLTNSVAHFNQFLDSLTMARQMDSGVMSQMRKAYGLLNHPTPEMVDPGASARTVGSAITATVGELNATNRVLPQATQQSVDRVMAGLGEMDPGVRLSDTVTNWQGEGDLSRYQYLVITIGAVALFLIQLFRMGNFPTIPEEFLYTIGISQATYVGMKFAQKGRMNP